MIPKDTRQWVFPASAHYVDSRTGIRHRHHLHESVIQKAVHEAARRAQLVKVATPHGALLAHIDEGWWTGSLCLTFPEAGRFGGC